MKYSTIRITAEARKVLDELAKKYSEKLGVKVDLTSAASKALIERAQELKDDVGSSS